MVGDLRETNMGYIVGDKVFCFYSAEAKWIRKVQRWQEQYPDEVEITHENYEDGKLDSIIAEMPIRWMKVSPPKKMNLTEEQKQAARDRLQKARLSKL